MKNYIEISEKKSQRQTNIPRTLKFKSSKVISSLIVKYFEVKVCRWQFRDYSGIKCDYFALHLRQNQSKSSKYHE